MNDMLAQVELLIKSDAELASLIQFRDQLSAGLKLARDSGKDLAPLEAELRKVNQEIGGRALTAWRTQLEGAIEAAKAGGQPFDNLARQLAALADVKPPQINELAALRHHQERLEDMVTAARAAGRESGALEERLAAVNRELATRALNEHAKDLERVIADTRAAGRSTEELEAHLRALHAAKPLAPPAPPPPPPEPTRGEVLRSRADDLQRMIEAASAAGRNTEQLEMALKAVNREAGNDALAQWRAHLEALIAAEEKAGRSTGELKGQLAALSKTEVRGMWGNATAEVKRLLDTIPGVGAFTRMLNGSTLAVGSSLALFAGGARLAAAGVREYAAAEREWAALDQALANRGQLVEGYRAQLAALATQLQGQTGIADESWLAAFARLTAAGLSPANVDRTAEAVKHLAGLLEGDVNQASVLVARALQGNFEGLSRLGIMFEKTGDQSRDLERFFGLLAERGGGLLEARMDTLSGRAAAARNAFGDFKEAIGQLVADTGLLQQTLIGVQGALEFWAGALGRPVDALDGINNRLERAAQVSDAARESARRLADEGLKKIGDEARGADVELERVLRRLRELARQGQEKIDANLQVELAKLDAGDGEYAGLNDAQKQQQRAALRRDADTRRQTIEDNRAEEEARLIQERQAARARAAGEAEAAAARDAAAHEAARKANELAVAENNRRQIASNTARIRVEQAQQALGQAQERYRDSGGAGLYGGTGGAENAAEIARLERELAIAQQAARDAARAFNDAKPPLEKSAAAVEATGRDSQQSRSIADALRAQANEGEREARERVEGVTGERAHARGVAAARAEAEAIRERAPGRAAPRGGEPMDPPMGGRVAEYVEGLADDVRRSGAGVGNPELKRALAGLAEAAQSLRDGGSEAEIGALLGTINAALARMGRGQAELRQQLAKLSADLQGQLKEAQN